MRKSLIALAALAAAGAASAQSSVTLFGVVDTAVSHYTVKSAFYDNRAVPTVAPLVPPVGVKRSQTALSAFAARKIWVAGCPPASGSKPASIRIRAPTPSRPSTVVRR